jgi:hypothetical protein
MGSKTCLLIQSQGDARQALATMPAPDEAATAGFVAALFPDTPFLRPGEADLSWTYVRDGMVLAGCSEGLRILVAAEVAIDEPSRLPQRFIAAQGRTILHSMNSVVDWLAFAVWEDGLEAIPQCCAGWRGDGGLGRAFRVRAALLAGRSSRR